MSRSSGLLQPARVPGRAPRLRTLALLALLGGALGVAGAPTRAASSAAGTPSAVRAAKRAASVASNPAPADAPADPFELVLRQADDHPAETRAALEALPMPEGAAAQRALLMARAETAARSTDADEAAQLRARAVVAARAVAASLAAADDLYLQAVRLNRDQPGVAAERARAALAAYESHCRHAAKAASVQAAASPPGPADRFTPSPAEPAASAAAPLPASTSSRPASGVASGGSAASRGPSDAAGQAAAPAVDGSSANARSAAASEPGGPGAATVTALGCETPRRWRLLQLMAAAALQQRAPGSARQHARAALDLAIADRDPWRQAWSESTLAQAATDEHDNGRAAQHLARARLLAERLDDARLNIRLLVLEAGLAQAAGQHAQSRSALRQALAAARAAQAPRLEAVVLVNLSDEAVHGGQPREALDAALQGLPIARRLQLKRVERALQANAVLARVALGQRAQALQEFELVQAAWAADGDTGSQVNLMREYSDALAQAGDPKAAIEVHHRERALSSRLMAANRDAALAELRTRYDREAQERKVLLLERDNAIKSAELDNQALSRRLWALGAGVLTLTIVLMLVLMRRVREANRALEHSRARLRVQSERDALTGLANRRHVQAALHAGGQGQAFRGALMMIDIDHFKRINDEHGHSSGDAVLVEVARRIASAVRGDDIVARWGGEEFLILAPNLAHTDADALAQRLLLAVAGTPVALPSGQLLRVTVSIGQAVFPLPPHQVALTPEQAVNLADMALYTAKSQGRNRAVGIVRADAADASALRRLEADFERAWLDGQVQLRVDPGPREGGPAPEPHRPKATT